LLSSQFFLILTVVVVYVVQGPLSFEEAHLFRKLTKEFFLELLAIFSLKLITSKRFCPIFLYSGELQISSWKLIPCSCLNSSTLKIQEYVSENLKPSV